MVLQMGPIPKPILPRDDKLRRSQRQRLLQNRSQRLSLQTRMVGRDARGSRYLAAFVVAFQLFGLPLELVQIGLRRERTSRHDALLSKAPVVRLRAERSVIEKC